MASAPAPGSRVPRYSRMNPKKGVIERLYSEPPNGSVVLCLDEMGPESARSFAGRALVHAAPAEGHPAGRARPEIDYGRRGKGYVFGASRPATGEALTQCYARRSTANWVDFLGRVEYRAPPRGVTGRARG
jgi:hypothetical protein